MVARDTVVKEARDVEKILASCKTKSDILAVVEQYGLDKNSVTVWPRYVPKESYGKSWKKLDELKEDETFHKFCIDAIWPDSHISVFEYSVDQKNLRFEVWDSSIDTRAPISKVETVESFINGYDALEQKIKNDVPVEIYVKMILNLKENVDFVVVTGDLVDGNIKVTKEMLEPFYLIKCPIYYITGNHEELTWKEEFIKLILFFIIFE